jgi:hypothetical protein
MKASPSDGAFRLCHLQSPGGLNRHIKHAAQKGHADKFAPITNSNQVLDHGLGHLHDVPLIFVQMAVGIRRQKNLAHRVTILL